MKNTLLGKTLTQSLSVVLCAAILIMIVCTFCPYFTVSEQYVKYVNENPQMKNYSLFEAMWCNVDYSEFDDDMNRFNPSLNNSSDFSVYVIRLYFEEQYANFDFNKYITNMVISFVFAIAALATSIWFAANEYRKFPSLVSGIFAHICAIGCALFSMMGYMNNAMLSLGNPKFMYIRTVIVALIFAILVLAIVRFVVWLLTEIQLAKEKKARLALL